MLYIVLILVLAALALLVTALITAGSLWAWVSIGLSVLAGLILLVDWVRRRNRSEPAAEGESKAADSTSGGAEATAGAGTAEGDLADGESADAGAGVINGDLADGGAGGAAVSGPAGGEGNESEGETPEPDVPGPDAPEPDTRANADPSAASGPAGAEPSGAAEPSADPVGTAELESAEPAGTSGAERTALLSTTGEVGPADDPEPGVHPLAAGTTVAGGMSAVRDTPPAQEETSADDLAIVTELDVEVVVVDEYPRYHLVDCPWLSGRDTIPIGVGEARQLGFTPCGRCGPDAVLARAHRMA